MVVGLQRQRQPGRSRTDNHDIWLGHGVAASTPVSLHHATGWSVAMSSTA
jgi:hypothetical protein